MKKLKRLRSPFFVSFVLYMVVAHVIFFSLPFAPKPKVKEKTPTSSTIMVVEEILEIKKPSSNAVAVASNLKKAPQVAKKTAKVKKAPKPSAKKLTTKKGVLPRPLPVPKNAPIKSTLKPLTLPGKITNLHSKKATLEEPVPVSSNINYASRLVSIMQRSLKLPNYGEVKLSITLHCSGKVIAIDIVSSENHENKNYLLNHLPDLVFPPFEETDSSQQQTFTINFFNS